MIHVKRVESGKILHEDFSEEVDLVADGWQLHPSVNRFHIDRTEGSLVISHGEQTAFLLREMPENIVMEMTNTYNPIDIYDFGGFVAYVTEQHRLELLEYYNEDIGTTVSFPWVRMVKKDKEYEGYGSEDGRNWDIRGSIEFPEATLWGVELEGLAGQELRIHTLTLYKNTELLFRALPLGGRIEVYNLEDEDNPELIEERSNTDYEERVSVFEFPMPMKKIGVKVYDEEDELVADDEHENVYGGDVYHCGNFLEVYYAGRPLDTYQNNFGYINSFYKDFQLELRNMIGVPHLNVNLEIKRYLEEFGWEWVEVCHDDNGAPSGIFGKTLLFDEVPASGSIPFWVRITRSSVPVDVDDYVFDFAINVW